MKNKLSVIAGTVGAFALLIAAPAFADTLMNTSMDSSMNTMNATSMSAMIQSDLTVGSNGDGVTALQSFLVSKGYLMMPAGVSMGHFGNLTRDAVKKYQMSVGISATGYFGPLTRAAYAKMAMSSMNTQVGVMVGGALMTPDKDIVQNAVNANNVTTVVAAVKAAGIVSTLEGAGPFTVFAPDNAAFAKLPAGTVDTLLMPANLSQLKDILTYHVVAGRYTTADLYNNQVLTTVEGKTLKITKDASGKIWINGAAMIETPNVLSSNGVTHVIDTVLMPSSN